MGCGGKRGASRLLCYLGLRFDWAGRKEKRAIRTTPYKQVRWFKETDGKKSVRFGDMINLFARLYGYRSINVGFNEVQLRTMCS